VRAKGPNRFRVKLPIATRLIMGVGSGGAVPPSPGFLNMLAKHGTDIADRG